ncbi:MAG TPA: hypothetical protein VME47_12060 [Acetobacteraceae bacterium]|nr:hypothetical protein [Acetobacteraceae bacterium]
MREIDGSELLRYRCHVGHAFTAEAVQADQGRRSEKLPWNLVRDRRERMPADRMAEGKGRPHHDDAADMLRRRARGHQEDARIVRRLFYSTRPEEPTRDQGEMP